MANNNKSMDVVRPAGNGTTKKNNIWYTLGWTGMLFVVGSIAFSSYMVYFGSDNLMAKIMIAPQVLFAAGVAIYKFASNK